MDFKIVDTGSDWKVVVDENPTGRVVENVTTKDNPNVKVDLKMDVKDGQGDVAIVAVNYPKSIYTMNQVKDKFPKIEDRVTGDCPLCMRMKALLEKDEKFTIFEDNVLTSLLPERNDVLELLDSIPSAGDLFDIFDFDDDD